MIRFLIKTAFLLGLVALLLPGRPDSVETADAGIDPFIALMGAQAAVADIWGFCDRAPAACAAGSDLAHFAGDRIGDGLALAYRTIQGGQASQPVTTEVATAPATTPRQPAAANANPAAARPDSIVTGAVAQVLELARPLPAAATKPAGRNFAMPGIETTRKSASQPRPEASVPTAAAPARLPVPRPAPRA
ncbi:DUF5330 domain-containing protein [Aurantimonas sp. A2-1-M11]|uniref:DUF5330 domain-containing protein n=1 Tax=Aurantimonas sp. A2-1-M11 TaxID=3113712 RepID=UPI002F9526D3